MKVSRCTDIQTLNLTKFIMQAVQGQEMQSFCTTDDNTSGVIRYTLWKILWEN
jgi:hypothetical protein